MNAETKLLSVERHTWVLDTRLDALKAAIRDRDWESVEFQYDRVLRATTKLERLFEDQPVSKSGKSVPG